MSDQEINDNDTSLSPSVKGDSKERRKIEIKFIENKTRRHVTFSKRKHGIMKKAFELSVLTGTQVLLLVVSETGLVYTFSTPKFEPIVTQQEGRNLIQACLNAPDEEEEEEEEEENGDNDLARQQQQQQQQVQQQAQAQAQAQVQQHQQMQQMQQMQQHNQMQQNVEHPFNMDNSAPNGLNPSPDQKMNNPNPNQNPNGNPNPNNAVYQQYFQDSQQSQF